MTSTRRPSMLFSLFAAGLLVPALARPATAADLPLIGWQLSGDLVDHAELRLGADGFQTPVGAVWIPDTQVHVRMLSNTELALDLSSRYELAGKWLLGSSGAWQYGLQAGGFYQPNSQEGGARVAVPISWQPNDTVALDFQGAVSYPTNQAMLEELGAGLEYRPWRPVRVAGGLLATYPAYAARTYVTPTLAIGFQPFSGWEVVLNGSYETPSGAYGGGLGVNARW